MAGLRGGTAWIMGTKQSVKGTPATTGLLTTYKNGFSGGNIGPVRETDNLAETDSARDRGTSYVTTAGVEGSPEIYAREDSLGAYLFWALGADAPTGTTNYVHTITPANTLPYVTFWKNLGDTLWEQYRDCKVSTLTIGAEAGQPLTATVGIQGAVSTRLTSDPSTSPAIPLANSLPLNFNNGAILLGPVGAPVSTALVSSFELTIENNVTRQQTDDVSPYDVVEGQREIDLSFDMIFETLDEYNRFHYGGVSGTTTSPTVYTGAATFTFTLSANNEVSFALPRIAYEELSPEPDPGGDPVTVSVRAVGQRGATPIITATVKNQVATY